MTEDELWDVDFLLGVHFNGNTAPVVPDTNFARLAVDSNTDLVHVLIVLLVIGGVDDNFIKNLVQTRHEGNLAVLHTLHCVAIYPHLLCSTLGRPDICIRTFDNMF